MLVNHYTWTILEEAWVEIYKVFEEGINFIPKILLRFKTSYSFVIAMDFAML